MSAPRTTALLTAALFMILASTFILEPTAHADQLLLGGDFEQGTGSWYGAGSVVGGCEGRGGGAGARIDETAANVSLLRQAISGPFSDSQHVLHGYLRLLSGAPDQVVAQLVWLNDDDDFLYQDELELSPGSDFAGFELASVPAAGAASLRVEVALHASAPASICLDDLSLSADPAPDTTPTSTPTVAISITPTAPSSAATSAPTTSPTRTPTPGPVLDFVNGGFEDGLYGWRKYGGELSLAPDGLSGRAGRLGSDTESTKWAYQTVAIEPGQSYEFEGYVEASGAVESAYLRISWYESGDGSGEAVSTADSTLSVPGVTDGFVYLTTGAQTAPDNARSARLRVMLAPAGAAPAALLLDEFDFSVTLPATPTATVQPPTETPSPPATEAQSTPAVTVAETTSTAEVAGAVATAAPPTSTLLAQVSSIRSAPQPTAVTRQSPPSQPEDDSGPALPPWPLLGLPASLLAVGAGYVFARRSSG